MENIQQQNMNNKAVTRTANFFGKIHVRLISVLIVLGIIILLSILVLGATRTSDLLNKKVIYQFSEGWGPCSANEICEQDTILYSDRSLERKGERNSTSQVPASDFEYIKLKLNQIIDADCKEEIILDYWAIAKIDFEGKTKKVRFPGCSDLTTEINNLLK